MRWIVFAGAALVVVAALAAVACSGSGGTGEQAIDVDLRRTGEAEGVSIDATWLTAESLDAVPSDLRAYPVSDFVLLEIAFTTHSGDLNQIEMERAAVLSQGGAEERPVAWVGTSDDSHHRAGVLVFDWAVSDGPAELTLELSEERIVLLWESVPSA